MPIPIAAAILGGAAITAGAGILGGRAQAKAAKRATRAQTAAVSSTLDLQKFMYDTQREDTAAWRDVGEQALAGLAKNYPKGVFDPANFDFETDPGFEFRRSEGEKALERGAAARGNRLSGAQMKDLTRFSENLATEEYQRAWNRNLVEKNTSFNQLASMANIGQTGVNQVGAAGQNYANAGGNALLRGGTASANAFTAAGNAQAGMYQQIGGAANQGIGNMLLYQMLQNPGVTG